MSLRIYNSMTRQKEPLTPATPGEVRMYVCGVTPYDLSHVGHARSALVFDVVRRYLVYRGYRVRFVKNFTDVDDKIIARAARAGEAWRDLADRYVRTYDEEMEWLGVELPSEAPKATDHVADMIALIERLLAAGVGYVVEGDVYFEVRRFPSYGRLSRRALDELRAGARVEVDERKRDPLDFALWKASKPGEPTWASPWGPGRPGWHIECSAMSIKYLGESFDIHGGGQDLVFPHHENEIAQSEGATGRPFARVWMHNGLVNFGAEKMSKSLGNIRTIQGLGRHHREAVRLHLLETHYRSPLEFWEPRIEESRRALDRLRGIIGRAFRAAGEAGIPGEDLDWTEVRMPFVEDLLQRLEGDEFADQVRACTLRFTDAMDDDFNTPGALAALSGLRDALNRDEAEGLAGERLTRFCRGAGVLLALGRVLGLFWWQVNPYEFTRGDLADFEPLLAEREEARRRRDWKRADELRAELDRRGVLVEDTPQGPRLRWKREPSAG